MESEYYHASFQNQPPKPTGHCNEAVQNGPVHRNLNTSDIIFLSHLANRYPISGNETDDIRQIYKHFTDNVKASVGSGMFHFVGSTNRYKNLINLTFTSKPGFLQLNGTTIEDGSRIYKERGLYPDAFRDRKHIHNNFSNFSWKSWVIKHIDPTATYVLNYVRAKGRKEFHGPLIDSPYYQGHKVTPFNAVTDWGPLKNLLLWGVSAALLLSNENNEAVAVAPIHFGLFVAQLNFMNSMRMHNVAADKIRSSWQTFLKKNGYQQSKPADIAKDIINEIKMMPNVDNPVKNYMERKINMLSENLGSNVKMTNQQMIKYIIHNAKKLASSDGYSFLLQQGQGLKRTHEGGMMVHTVNAPAVASFLKEHNIVRGKQISDDLTQKLPSAPYSKRGEYALLISTVTAPDAFYRVHHVKKTVTRVTTNQLRHAFKDVLGKYDEINNLIKARNRINAKISIKLGEIHGNQD